MTTPIKSPHYETLLETISHTYTQGRVAAMQVVNHQLLETYWQIGRHMVEFEQDGEYGRALLDQLARDLSLRHGRDLVVAT